ncbi:sulfotransferase domain-containing protein [Candidatus Pelagibacter sp.]|nr:sulfotransferase domain-containing protein [Candidatus Pelagibacter sp.]
MFIWLASYPKSGNTLIRSLLVSYFFSKDGNFNFDLIKNIKQFPTIELFESLGIDIKNQKEVIENYIKVQDSINQKNIIQFLKTHSYLFNIDGNGFTNLNNSLGAIYIVRDPRTIVSSSTRFFNISQIEAADRLINTTFIGGDLNNKRSSNRTTVYTGTWSGNYNSWKSFKSNGKYLLIKYEDLIFNKEESLKKILKFIHKLKNINFEINEKKFQNVIDSTSFESMQKLERKNGFNESSINEKTGEKIAFFNLGPKNDWKKSLDLEVINKIEKAFKKEMEELGYL